MEVLMSHNVKIPASHPLWISTEYDKNEYEKQLLQLNQAVEKSEGIYVTEKNTLGFWDLSTLRGKVTYVFYNIIGYLGFQNPFDTVKVNYELLKMLRYGVSQHFFEDENIKKLILDLKAILIKQKEEEYQTFIDTIHASFDRKDKSSNTSIMCELNVTIQRYYENHLKLFQKQTQPFTQDAEYIKYNEGCIQAETNSILAIKTIGNAIREGLGDLLENELNTIVRNEKEDNAQFDRHEFQRQNSRIYGNFISEAVDQNPRKTARILQLCQVYAQRIDELIKHREFATASILCNQAFWIAYELKDLKATQSFCKEIEEIIGMLADAYHAMGQLCTEDKDYERADTYYENAKSYSEMVRGYKNTEWNFEHSEVRLHLAAQLQQAGNFIEAAAQYQNLVTDLASITARTLYGGDEILEAFRKRDYETIAAHFSKLYEIYEPGTKPRIDTPEAVEKHLLPLITIEQKLDHARFQHVQQVVLNCGYPAVNEVWRSGLSDIASFESPEENNELFLKVYTCLLVQQLKEDKQDAAIKTFREAVNIIYTGWAANMRACRALIQNDPTAGLPVDKQINFYRALRNTHARELMNMQEEFAFKLREIPPTVEEVLGEQKKIIEELLLKKTSPFFREKLDPSYLFQVVDLLIKEGFYVELPDPQTPYLSNLKNDRVLASTFSYSLLNEDDTFRTLESIKQEIETDLKAALLNEHLQKYEVIKFSEIKEHCEIIVDEELKSRIEFLGRFNKETGAQELIAKLDGNFIKISSRTFLSFDLSTKLNVHVKLIDEKIVISVRDNVNNKTSKATIKNYPRARAKVSVS